MGLFEFLLLEKLGQSKQSGSCAIHSFIINSHSVSNWSHVIFSELSDGRILGLNAKEPYLFSPGQNNG